MWTPLYLMHLFRQAHEGLHHGQVRVSLHTRCHMGVCCHGVRGGGQSMTAYSFTP